MIGAELDALNALLERTEAALVAKFPHTYASVPVGLGARLALRKASGCHRLMIVSGHGETESFTDLVHSIAADRIAASFVLRALHDELSRTADRDLEAVRKAAREAEAFCSSMEGFR